MKSRLAIFVIALALESCNGDTAKQKYVAKGDQLFSIGEYEKAAEMYGEAASVDPKFALAYYGQGRSLIRMGRYPEAQQALRRATQLFAPNSAERNEAEVQLAYALVHGWNDEDLAEVEKVGVALCKRDSNSFDGRLLLGDLALVRARKWASIKTRDCERCDFFLNDALGEFNIAVRARPGDIPAAIQLARSFAVKGSWSQSEAGYRTAQQLDRKRPEVYAELYRVLLAQGKLPAAAEDLKQAMANVPAYPGFALMLAAQAVATDPSSAPPFIEQLKSRELGLPAANLIAGDFYLRAGQPDRARREYRNCFAAKKYEMACRVRLIRMALFENDDRGLQQLVKETLQSDQENTAARTADAMTKMNSGDTDAAERELRGLLSLDPDGPIASYYLARLQVQHAQLQEARQTLEFALQRQPQLFGARLLLANIQLALLDYSDARKSAEAILAAGIDDPQARKILDTAKEASADANVALGALERFRNNTLGMLSVMSPGLPGTMPQAIKLKDSVCDATIAAFKTLRSKDYDRFDLAAAVPGVWSADEFTAFFGK